MGGASRQPGGVKLVLAGWPAVEVVVGGQAPLGGGGGSVQAMPLRTGHHVRRDGAGLGMKSWWGSPPPPPQHPPKKKFI